MSKTPARDASTPRKPLWRSDARKQLQMLLPELVLSIVSAACMTIVVEHGGNYDVSTLIVTLILSQIAMQSVLYAFMYLSNYTEAMSIALLLLLSLTPMLSVLLPALGLTNAAANHLSFALNLSVATGAITFFLTRLRSVFVFLLIEVLSVTPAITSEPSLLIPHLVGLSALIALFIVRSSPSHVTSAVYTSGAPVARDDTAKGKLPLYGQVVLLASFVGALCLAVALGAAWLADWGQSRIDDASSPTSQTIQVDPEAEANDDDTSESDQVEAIATDGTGESHAQDDALSGQPDSSGTSSARGLSIGLLPVVLFALALLALPFVVRLLMREMLRRSIAREPRVADQAARIYLGVLSRLKAVGIERDEEDTPREFLVLHEEDLEALSASAGIDASEWTTLTDVYERARYADLDPTQAELEMCWHLYDALPACARESLGWLRYLTGAFWRM